MKTKTLFFLIAATLFFAQLQAQVNIGGSPVSYDFENRGVLETLSFVQTPSLDMAAIEAEDAQWEIQRQAGIVKIGRRFGIEFTVDYGLHNAGAWTCLPDGGKLWRLGVECPEALSINLIFDQYRLPEGATVYIYSEDKRDKIGGFTNYNNQADGFFATDVVLSDKVIIEYYQPANADFDGELHLSTIVHGYRGPGEFTKELGESGSCQRNVICPEGEGWEDQIRSVFALYDGGSEICSGAMINNTANDGKPYALTANHCYEAATNPGTWVFRFNWESPTCSPTTNSTYQTMTGATLKMRTVTSTSGTDACLVELNQPIPDDYNVFFAGWSRSTTPSPSGMCIHHPSLDIKKISPSNALYIVTQYVKGWRADWSTGACTEGGSSGSPLFDNNHRIVGQEYGGRSYCGASASDMFDVYGRFDQSWDGTASSNRLKDWLDPLGLDPETLDGYDPNATAIVDAELLDIVVPEETYYLAETIEPQVIIKNNGDNDITSATVSYTIDGGDPVTKLWTGSIAVGDITNITFDIIPLTFGTHIFSASVTVTGDTNFENNSKTKNYDVQDCLLDDAPLQEDFEEDGLLPTCWQNIPTSGTTTWTFVTNGNNGQGNPIDPQTGSYNARFQSDNNDDAAYLIAPPMNIVDISMPQPVLTFWHAQAKYGNKQDTLRVYYKNNSGETWTLLQEFSDDIAAWKKENILLPNPSSTYWIAFEGVSAGGSGVVLDNIAVINTPECSPVQSLETEQSGNQVTVRWMKLENTEDVTGYTFYVNGNEIATVIDTFYTISVEQMTYEFCVVALYDYEWCQESSMTCTSFEPVSVDELSDNNHFKIYPNPTNNHLTITGKDMSYIELFNVHGKKVATYQTQEESMTIDNLSQYAAGIYFIKIYTIDNQSVVKIFSIVK